MELDVGLDVSFDNMSDGKGTRDNAGGGVIVRKLG
jgi:hypothetical protein